MKKTTKDIEEQIDKTLQSLDKIKQSKPKTFFYTRLHARLENELRANVPQKTSLQWSKLALFMLLLLVLNVSTIILISKKNQGNTSDTLIETYKLNTPELYEN